jgi:hypothetical protein
MKKNNYMINIRVEKEPIEENKNIQFIMLENGYELNGVMVTPEDSQKIHKIIRKYL